MATTAAVQITGGSPVWWCVGTAVLREQRWANEDGRGYGRLGPRPGVRLPQVPAAETRRLPMPLLAGGGEETAGAKSMNGNGDDFLQNPAWKLGLTADSPNNCGREKR